uniref:Uncharacterized protein n=1 Tax=Brassica campestris TaxID=3711 RepID=M4CRK0_BRACM
MVVRRGLGLLQSFARNVQGRMVASDPVQRLLFRSGLLPPPPPMVAMGRKGGERDTRTVDPMTGRYVDAENKPPILFASSSSNGGYGTYRWRKRHSCGRSDPMTGRYVDAENKPAVINNKPKEEVNAEDKSP